MRSTDIPRVDPLEPARFERDYRRARRPVVVRGLVPEHELSRWSFAALAAEFRDLTVPIHVTRAGAVTADPRRGVHAQPRALAELLEQLGAVGTPSLYMMAPLDELPAAWRDRITTPARSSAAASFAIRAARTRLSSSPPLTATPHNRYDGQAWSRAGPLWPEIASQ